MTEPLLLVRFRAWLQEHVAADADGKRLASEADLWAFLDEAVFSDPGTVKVEGSTVSALWAYRIDADEDGDDEDGNYNADAMARDLATRSHGKVRVIANTQAGEFLAFLDDPVRRDTFGIVNVGITV